MFGSIQEIMQLHRPDCKCVGCVYNRTPSDASLPPLQQVLDSLTFHDEVLTKTFSMGKVIH